MRGGSRYGPQDPNNQFSAYQGPYPPPRAYPNDAIPGYYYYGTRAEPHLHFRQSPALRNGPHPDFTSGTAPGPPQQRNHLPPAQSTTPQSKDTPPESEVDATFLQGKIPSDSRPQLNPPSLPACSSLNLVPGFIHFPLRTFRFRSLLEAMVPYQTTAALTTSTRVPLPTSAASLPTTLLSISMCPLPAQADPKLSVHVRGVSLKLQNPVISAKIGTRRFSAVQSGPDDSPGPPIGSCHSKIL
ncbi:hypothetical protein BKA83DRAFT_4124299 [Pisolithus microcarpus]|nr:hypothetical protein BKA83DRAFT_4124299 [Pisolithus microcarpus]